MVWPILISVAVTPRISAAPALNDDIASAAIPATPRPAAKRILPSPVLFSVIGTCHVGALDAMHFGRAVRLGRVLENCVSLRDGIAGNFQIAEACA
jgi:hypothetical protein